MSVADTLLTILAAAGVFLVVDIFWLGTIAKNVYSKYIGDFLLAQPRKLGAALFYVLYILGVYYFVIEPSVTQQNPARAVVDGALLGAFAYMTYELTNYAVHKKWPWQIVVIDIVWGTLLTTAVAGLSYWIAVSFIV